MMRALIFIVFVLFTFTSANTQTKKERDIIVSSYDLSKAASLESTFKEQNKKRDQRIWTFVSSLNQQERSEIDISRIRDISLNGKPMYYVAHNFASAISIRANELYSGGSLGLDLRGSNMIAGLWEAEGGYPLGSHSDLIGRVNIIDGGGSVNFHATHVAGTIISSGASTFDNFGKGIAFEASVLAANSVDDMSEMSAQAALGLLVSNHSYGYGAGNLDEWFFGAYNNDASSLDNITHSFPFYLPVISAGNDRDDFNLYNPTKGGFDLLTGMSNSKNGISSAAVEGVANYQNPFSVVMSSFSNYGPTDDGRIKPDISSQGVLVNSTSNASDTGYSNSSGTSMSAPAISGLLLLLQEHYNNVNSVFMKGATAKGLLLHTADEAGSFIGPDYRFGWGLANGERAAQAITDAFAQNDSFIEEATLNNSETRTVTVAATGNEPLMISISWTDPAAFPVFNVLDSRIPVLINDLDIEASSNGNTFYPWKLDPLVPQAGAIRNSSNDVDVFEKIEIDAPAIGEVFQLDIDHKGNLSGGSQDYSLIITGGNITSLSLRDNIENLGFKLFPNPTTGSFTISLSTASTEEIDIAVTDLQGRKVFQSKHAVNSQVFEKELNLNHIKSGMYLVTVEQNGYFKSERIIIE